MKIEMLGAYVQETGTTTSKFGPVVFDFGFSEREQPSLQADTMRIERAYDRAVASLYESGWEQFVAQAAESASEYQKHEIAWLLDRVQNGAGLPFRRALSLVRAAGAIAEVRQDMSTRFAVAFASMLTHPVAEVRSATLEAASEADVASAKALARGLAEDASPTVRETVNAILAMTE